METNIKVTKFPDPDNVDVFTLNCNDLIEWLNTQNIASSEVQEVFKGLFCTHVANYMCIVCVMSVIYTISTLIFRDVIFVSYLSP